MFHIYSLIRHSIFSIKRIRIVVERLFSRWHIDYAIYENYYQVIVVISYDNNNNLISTI